MAAPSTKLFAVFLCRVPGRHRVRGDGTKSDYRVEQLVWKAIPLDAQWQMTEERPADVVRGLGIWPAESRAAAIRDARESEKSPRSGGRKR